MVAVLIEASLEIFGHCDIDDSSAVDCGGDLWGAIYEGASGVDGAASRVADLGDYCRGDSGAVSIDAVGAAFGDTGGNDDVSGQLPDALSGHDHLSQPAILGGGRDWCFYLRDQPDDLWEAVCGMAKAEGIFRLLTRGALPRALGGVAGLRVCWG